MQVKESTKGMIIKSMMFLCGLLIALLIYQYFQNEWNSQDQLKENQDKIEAIKKEQQEYISKVKDTLATKVDSMVVHIESLSEYSNQLTQQIKRYEKRPNIDIDFITAYGIISNSKYRPTKGDDNAGQGEDN